MLGESVMNGRENDAYSNHVRFNGNDIVLAAKMLDSLSTTIEFVYYLMNRGEERSFVLMLISAEDADVYEVLKAEKRNTDILFEIDKEQRIYTIICQDTKIDGGYHFGDRVMRQLKSRKAKEPYCIELEVRITTYNIKYIIFKLMETYLQSKKEKAHSKIVYKSIL